MGVKKGENIDAIRVLYLGCNKPTYQKKKIERLKYTIKNSIDLLLKIGLPFFPDQQILETVMDITAADKIRNKISSKLHQKNKY